MLFTAFSFEIKESMLSFVWKNSSRKKPQGERILQGVAAALAHSGILNLDSELGSAQSLYPYTAPGTVSLAWDFFEG